MNFPDFNGLRVIKAWQNNRIFGEYLVLLEDGKFDLYSINDGDYIYKNQDEFLRSNDYYHYWSRTGDLNLVFELQTKKISLPPRKDNLKIEKVYKTSKYLYITELKNGPGISLYDTYRFPGGKTTKEPGWFSETNNIRPYFPKPDNWMWKYIKPEYLVTLQEEEKKKEPFNRFKDLI